MLTDRQQQLFEWLQAQPKRTASIEAIEAQFGISSATAYREARALVQTSQAHRTRGGIKLGPPTDPPPAAGQCAFCGGVVHERAAFVIQQRDGTQRSACCPHCGLLALGQGDVLAALAADFLYGRMVNTRHAYFLLGSKVDLCCKPSVLCFATQEDARRFQRGFGGQVLTLEQALTRLREAMALSTSAL